MLDGQSFTRAVMQHLDIDPDADGAASELARQMGWGPNSPRQVSRWLAGVHLPGYEPTMQMLERCGWLNVNTSNGAAAPEQLIGEIAARVAILQDHIYRERGRR